MLKIAFALALLPLNAAAQSCVVDFTIRVTQGVGPITPGQEISGQADYTPNGRSFRQEGGSTAHFASGEMRLGDTIRGPIWTLVTTSRGHAADLVANYARQVEGFDFAGQSYRGPMVISLFGVPGARPDTAPPTTQEEWDRMDVRRAFALHSDGMDMLAGTITQLTATCSRARN